MKLRNEDQEGGFVASNGVVSVYDFQERGFVASDGVVSVYDLQE